MRKGGIYGGRFGRLIGYSRGLGRVSFVEWGVLCSLLLSQVWDVGSPTIKTFITLHFAHSRRSI